MSNRTLYAPIAAIAVAALLVVLLAPHLAPLAAPLLGGGGVAWLALWVAVSALRQRVALREVAAEA